MRVEALGLTAGLLLSFASGQAAYALARVTPAPRPRLGVRGLQRQRALATHSGFAAFEPLLRWLSPLVALWPLGAVRAWLTQRLIEAGQPLGLDADESLALACLGAVSAALAAGACAHVLQTDVLWALPAGAVGAATPLLRLAGLAAERKRALARELPAAIDLVSLCVGAGLDFTSALFLLVRQPSDCNSPLIIEFARVLQELSLGHTRSEALSALAARAPISAMRDFTSAVIQAELKGNPLEDVIATQARMLRLQRSVLAEEAASRASVLLAFPLILLLAAILLLILGPFLIHGVEF